MTKILALIVTLFCCRLTAATKELNIYLVDVEGGGGTLIVGPAGDSLLIDTGIPGAEGRDPKRIHDLAVNVAHLKTIDYLLITHYHGDHVGGAPELSKLMPIGEISRPRRPYPGNRKARHAAALERLQSGGWRQSDDSETRR